MTEIQKNGVGKVVIIALSVLLMIVGVSTVYFYSNLQSQINSLTTDKNLFILQVNSLNTTYHDYQSTHTHNDSEFDRIYQERYIQGVEDGVDRGYTTRDPTYQEALNS